MDFKPHSDLVGMHAFLSASKYHWVNYDEAKMARTFHNQMAAQRGSELHDLASRMIKHNIKAQPSDKTFNSFVNDSIGYKMESEQPLFYSRNCFGTADAISFRKDPALGGDLLRIFDLKTGTGHVSMTQLYIYASLFCLEYGIEPEKIFIETRIYQNDAIILETPDAPQIRAIMLKIIKFDKVIERARTEEQL